MTVEGQGTFGISIDTDRGSFNTFDRTMDTVENRIKNVVKKWGGVSKATKSSVDSSSKLLRTYERAISTVNTKILKLQNSIRSSGNPAIWERQAAKVKLLKAQIASLRGEARALSSVVNNPYKTQAVDAYYGALGKITARINTLSKQMRTTGSQAEWKKLTAQLRAYKAALDSTANSLSKIKTFGGLNIPQQKVTQTKVQPKLQTQSRISVDAYYAKIIDALINVNKKLKNQHGAWGHIIKDNQKAKQIMERYKEVIKKISRLQSSIGKSSLPLEKIKAMRDTLSDIQMTFDRRIGQISNQHSGRFFDNAAQSAEFAKRKVVEFSDETWASLDRATKDLGKTEKGFDKVEKSTKKVNKQVDFMNSRFAKFSIVMSGIAATLFVFQSVVRGIQAIVRQGAEAENVLLGIKARLGEIGNEGNTLENLYKLPDDFGKNADVIKALAAAGYRGQQAADLLPDVVKYNRFLNDYDQAIDVATIDTFKLCNRLDELNKSFDETTDAVTGRFVNRFKKVGANISDFFIKPLRELDQVAREKEDAAAKAAGTYRYKINDPLQKTKSDEPLIDPAKQKSTYETIYKTRGKLTEQYYTILRNEIYKTAKAMKGNIDPEDTKFVDQWVKSQTRKLNRQKIESMRRVLTPGQVKLLEANFQETGYMDKRLYEHRKLMNDIKSIKQYQGLLGGNKTKNGVVQIGQDKDIRAASLARDLKNYKDYYGSLMQFEEEYFNSKKNYSEKLGAYRISVFEKEHELRVAQGVDEQLSNEMMMRQVEEINNRLNDSKLTGGLKQATRDYIDTAMDKFQQFRDIGVNAFKGIEDALVNLSVTGKLEFKNLINSMIADITRYQYKAAMAGLLDNIDFSSISKWFGGRKGYATMADAMPDSYTDNKMADGGYLGETVRGVGMKTGQSYELHANEFVLPPHKLGTGASDVKVPVTVNVIDQNGQQAEATASEPQFDGESWVINVVMESARTNKHGFGTFLQNMGGIG